VIELLCRVHAHEIMVDGVFTGDPHPGNVLLLPDGRLGLIDYGQTKRITREVRIAVARAVVALANDDQLEVVRVFKDDLGARHKYNKPEMGWRLAAFWFNTNGPATTGGRNIQQFMDWVEAEDPVVVTPRETVLVGRVAVLLRGVGNAFGLEMRTAELWESTARQVLKDEGVDYVPKKTRAF